MNTDIDIVYLPEMQRGRTTKRIVDNDFKEFILYNNFHSKHTKDTIRIKCGSLLVETFELIGEKGNCWFNKSNWGFEIENDRYFAFSHGNYSVVWDKVDMVYKKHIKSSSRASVMSSKIRLSEDDIKRIIKMRVKRGQRVV